MKTSEVTRRLLHCVSPIRVPTPDADPCRKQPQALGEDPSVQEDMYLWHATEKARDSFAALQKPSRSQVAPLPIHPTLLAPWHHVALAWPSGSLLQASMSQYGGHSTVGTQRLLWICPQESPRTLACMTDMRGVSLCDLFTQISFIFRPPWVPVMTTDVSLETLSSPPHPHLWDRDLFPISGQSAPAMALPSTLGCSRTNVFASQLGFALGIQSSPDGYYWRCTKWCVPSATSVLISASAAPVDQAFLHPLSLRT